MMRYFFIFPALGVLTTLAAHGEGGDASLDLRFPFFMAAGVGDATDARVLLSETSRRDERAQADETGVIDAPPSETQVDQAPEPEPKPGDPAEGKAAPAGKLEVELVDEQESKVGPMEDPRPAPTSKAAPKAQRRSLFWWRNSAQPAEKKSAGQRVESEPASPAPSVKGGTAQEATAQEPTPAPGAPAEVKPAPTAKLETRLESLGEAKSAPAAAQTGAKSRGRGLLWWRKVAQPIEKKQAELPVVSGEASPAPAVKEMANQKPPAQEPEPEARTPSTALESPPLAAHAEPQLHRLRQARPDEPAPTLLTLGQIAREAVDRNSQVIYESLQWDISSSQADYERAILEPEFFINYDRDRIHEPNSVEDLLSRSLKSEYSQESSGYETGLRGLFATGAQWKLAYTGDGRNSNVIDVYYKNHITEHENSLKLTLRQPLMRGRGKTATLAKTWVAEVNEKIAFLNYVHRVMESVGTAEQGYWALYEALELESNWGESLAVAEKLHADVSAAIKQGKFPQTELLEVESGIIIRKTELLSAKNQRIEAEARLMTLLNATEKKSDAPLIASEEPDLNKVWTPELGSSRELAFTHWPPALIARRKLDAARISLEAAKNMRWPQFDLVGSYGQSSLSDKSGDAFNDAFSSRYNSWNVGVELSMPIGNGKARSDQRMAESRRKQAENEIRAIENGITNSLRTRIEQLANARAQLQDRLRGVELCKALLDVETKKMAVGKSSSREVLKVEEDGLDSRRRYLRSLAEWKRAETLVAIAEGTLLDRYGITIEAPAPDR